MHVSRRRKLQLERLEDRRLLAISAANDRYDVDEDNTLTVVEGNGLLANDSLGDFAAPLKQGNILVSNTRWTGSADDARVTEYTPQGQFVQQFLVDDDGVIRDLVVDRNGLIQIFHGTFQPNIWVTTLDPSDGTLEQTTHDKWDISNNTSYGGIDTYKNFIYVADMALGGRQTRGVVRFDTDTGLARNFIPEHDVIDINMGDDGLLYILTKGPSAGGDGVFGYDPVTMEQKRKVVLPGWPDTFQRGIDVDADGVIYSVGHDNKSIWKYKTTGETAEVDTSIFVDQGGLADINLGPNGQIVVAAYGGNIIVSNTELSSFTKFGTRTNTVIYNFATWVQEPVGEADRELTIKSYGQPPNGTVQVNSNGSFNYTPDDHYFGTDRFTYVLTDGNEEVTSEVTIDVKSINDSPTLDAAEPNLGSVSEDDVYTIKVSDFFTQGSDVETENLGIGIYESNSNGSWLYNAGTGFRPFPSLEDNDHLVLAASSSLRYEPDGENGETVTIKYRAWDGTIGAAGNRIEYDDSKSDSPFSAETDTATLTVTDVNDAPHDATLDNQAVAENAAGAKVGDLTAHDVDTGDTHTFSVVSDEFTIDGNQLKLKEGVALDFESKNSYDIDVVVKDENGVEHTVTKTIQVTDENDAPTVENPLTDQKYVAGLLFGYFFPIDTFDDVDTGDSLRYTGKLANGDPLPAGLTVGASTRLIRGISTLPANEYDIVITATDRSGATAEDTIRITLLEASPKLNNPINKYDVNYDGDVAPLDALLIVNFINNPPSLEPVAPPFLDVSGDGNVAPEDILKIVNFLNSGIDDSEGEPQELPEPGLAFATGGDFSQRLELENVAVAAALSTIEWSVPIGPRQDQQESDVDEALEAWNPVELDNLDDYWEELNS